MRVFGLVLGLMAAMFTAMAASAQEKAWVQLEAQPSLSQAEERARAYAAAFPDVAGFSSGSGWFIVVLGPYLPEEAAGKIAALRRENLIPRDAFVSDGAGYGAPFWPVGAEAAGATETPAPEATAETEPVVEPVAPEPADETLKEARASEAALNKDDRKALQASLQWYGFYENAIDGAFGPGTRKSMAAWQEANGFEPTGTLTTRQRATLTANHAADLAEFGFESVSEPEAGIEITLPLSLVGFDHYDPPFVHFSEKDGSGLRILLISEPGGSEALAGLYDILQTLEVVPETGPRSRTGDSFTIDAVSEDLASTAFAQTRDGMVKGYLVVWKPQDQARMERILPVLKSSFRAVGDRALDPGLVPMEDTVRSGLLAGLEVKQPKSSRSGFFADARGHVLTSASAVAGCARVTLDHDTEAQVLFEDAASGIAVLKPMTALAPAAFAGLAEAPPRAGSEITVAGYSYEGRLPAPVLTFGSFEEPVGLNGEAGLSRLTVRVLDGDIGGPVLDGNGAVIGMLLPAPKSDQVLPEGVAFAADSASLAAAATAAGLMAGPAPATDPATPDALYKAASAMTVLVSCWEE